MNGVAVETAVVVVLLITLVASLTVWELMPELDRALPAS
jgi:hypothetical protein